MAGGPFKAPLPLVGGCGNDISTMIFSLLMACVTGGGTSMIDSTSADPLSSGWKAHASGPDMLFYPYGSVSSGSLVLSALSRCPVQRPQSLASCDTPLHERGDMRFSSRITIARSSSYFCVEDVNLHTTESCDRAHEWYLPTAPL